MAPCKDCQKRTINCHSVCEEYKQFKLERAAILKAKSLDNERYASMYESSRRHGHYKRRR